MARNNLGIVALEQGRFGDGLQHFEAALAVKLALLGEPHVEVTLARANIQSALGLALVLEPSADPEANVGANVGAKQLEGQGATPHRGTARTGGRDPNGSGRSERKEEEEEEGEGEEAGNALGHFSSALALYAEVPWAAKHPVVLRVRKMKEELEKRGAGGPPRQQREGYGEASMKVAAPGSRLDTPRRKKKGSKQSPH